MRLGLASVASAAQALLSLRPNLEVETCGAMVAGDDL